MLAKIAKDQQGRNPAVLAKESSYHRIKRGSNYAGKGKNL